MTSTTRGQPRIHELRDGSRRDLRHPERPRPVRVHVWEPERPLAAPAPLVVVSHGTGGSAGTMEWLALPLAEAGFRAVAIDHHGNNLVDGYEPEGFLFVWERPKDVTFVLDTLSLDGPLGPVGAVGFSLGGYTVAALAGARVDPVPVTALLAGHVPMPAIPEFPDVLEALRKKVPAHELRAALDGAGADVSDSRVRAAFQVAPALGGLMTEESLKAVRVPVGIRWGEADTINPFPEHIAPYLNSIRTAEGRSAGPEVRHEDFLETDPGGRLTRARVAEETVAFFLRHLGRPESGHA
ncbi:alpha/beta hydrolase family protein [Streptomyces marincola]|uniref:alpha/beta hydrolase family protein n=1 Tax=Streptomyces marincola TaxID=2878388 RepID=UPI001CF0D67F|nr:alpha/beta fold hydrolase [Streptomyces marincola]UCM88731.1 alpha/beta hydrolase [Streptomyces marincola]